MFIEEFDELVRLHDQYQFEVKLEYDLNKERRRDGYKVETFFFLPSNLDVNEFTYPKHLFYRDLLLYIRFKTPDFSLKEIIDAANSRSPLTKMAEKCEAFFREPTAGAAAGLEYEIKLLGCVLKSTLRDYAKAVERLHGNADADLLDYVREARAVVARYRSFRDRFSSPTIPKTLFSTYVFTDEYISLLIEGRTHQILQALVQMKVRSAQLAELADLAKQETDYRRAAGYPTVVSIDKDNEVFVFRLSVLKKFVANILHFTVETVEAGKGIQQAVLAVAAGIAMVFATGVAFYYQRTYGTLSVSFFVALVVSYMFKDRIKAICQEYFLKALSKNIFDKSTNIYDHFNGDKIGVCRQSCQFIDEEALGPVVLRLRNRDHITEIENDWRREQVLYYVKEIRLNSRNLVRVQSRKTGITDILRFNVQRLLRKMDEPSTDLYYLENGQSKTLPTDRVYHVNMIIKFASDWDVRYERIRLVLTRLGIKRIEPVSSESSKIGL